MRVVGVDVALAVLALGDACAAGTGGRWFTASYQAAFDASCNQLSLEVVSDGCTGGRYYFNGQTTLTRRPAAPAVGL